MSELKIEHITDYLHHYLITASDNRLSTCWKGEADYEAIESLQQQLEASEKLRKGYEFSNGVLRQKLEARVAELENALKDVALVLDKSGGLCLLPKEAEE